MATLYQFQYDLHQLAVGVLYLNLGLAGVEFPTTTRAHPSYQVFVLLTPKGSLDGSHKPLFPFQVRWDLWQRVVVPLFVEGDALVKVGVGTNETLRQWVNREYLANKDLTPLIAKIQSVLLAKLEEEGYLPAGTTEEGFVVEPVAPGEPVVPPGTPVGNPYTQFD